MQFPIEVLTTSDKRILSVYWGSTLILQYQIFTWILERTEDGQNWAILTPQIFNQYIFNDSNVTTEKEYRYRLKAIFVDNTESEYSYSNWVRTTDLRYGYGFNNPKNNSNRYAPAWGELVTADELRYIASYGNPLIAPNGETYTDDMLYWYIDQSISVIEADLNFHLIPQQYRSRPWKDPQTGKDQVRTDIPVGEEFQWEDPYDYKRDATNNYLYTKLRQKPILQVQMAHLRDVFGNLVIDLTLWQKPNHKMGSLEFYPHGNALVSMPMINVQQAEGRLPFIFSRDYPDAIFIDYQAGYDHASRIPKDFRRLVFLFASCMLLNDYGDGKSPGLASASVSLAGVSESYSTTQSASIGAKEKITVVDNNNISRKMKISKAFRLWKKGKLKYCKTLAVNPENIRDIQYKNVYDISEHETKNKQCFKIKTKLGVLRITEDHSIYRINETKLEKIKGKDLKRGDLIAIINNQNIIEEISIISIKKYKAKKMYDLSVAGFENFICNKHFVVSNTNALFGARINQFLSEIKLWYKQNKGKYQGVVLGVLG